MRRHRHGSYKSRPAAKNDRVKFKIALSAAGLTCRLYAKSIGVTGVAITRVLNGQSRSDRLSAEIDQFIKDQYAKHPLLRQVSPEPPATPEPAAPVIKEIADDARATAREGALEIIDRLTRLESDLASSPEVLDLVHRIVEGKLALSSLNMTYCADSQKT